MVVERAARPSLRGRDRRVETSVRIRWTVSPSPGSRAGRGPGRPRPRSSSVMSVDGLAHHRPGRRERAVQVGPAAVGVAELEGVQRGGEALHDVVVDLDRLPAPQLDLAEPERRGLALALGEVLLGDVDAGAAHPVGLAVLAEHHLAVGVQVAHLAVGPHDPLEHLVRLAGGVRVLVDALDLLPVVGMDHRQEPLVGGVEGLRLVPVDPVQLVRPAVGVGGDVPVVVTHVRQLLGVVHALLELLQLGRGIHAEIVAPRAPGRQSVTAISRDVRRVPMRRRAGGPSLACCAHLDDRRAPAHDRRLLGLLPRPGLAGQLLPARGRARRGGRTWRVLLDLGSGALGALQRHADPLCVDAVLLSHLHADHCLDLAGYYVLRKYHPAGAQPRIPVWGPAGTADRLAACVRPADRPRHAPRSSTSASGTGRSRSARSS